MEWGCTLGPGTQSCCGGQIPALVQGGRANLVEVSALFMNCFNRDSVQRKQLRAALGQVWRETREPSTFLMATSSPVTGCS